MTTSTLGIPPGLTAPDLAEGVQRGYFRPEAGPEVLKAFRKAMGNSSDRRMGRLLGVRGENYIWRWKKAKQRISQLYLGRMIILIVASLVDGTDFSQVKAINWETGEPEVQAGYENGNLRTTIKRHLQGGLGPAGASMGRPPQRPFWETGIQPVPKAGISPEQDSEVPDDGGGS